MISFIWSPGERLPAGTGGSENYTTGHVRELTRRGVAAQVVTIGLGARDGREEFPGVPFRSLASLAEVSSLAGTVVFVNDIAPVATRQQAFVMLHNPPPIRGQHRAFTIASIDNRVPIATSRYAAALWAEFLRVDVNEINVAYPFAEPQFAGHARAETSNRVTRVLYAGRLSPEKGVYTLLSMLHLDGVAEDRSLTFTATTAGSDKAQGRIIEGLVAAHPRLTLVPARRTPIAMSDLMAEHDVVVMPSNSQYWHETFGIVSVEAQHAGCRVVASNDGGLPETDCGALILVEPDNAHALAAGIETARTLGPISADVRRSAARRFTVAQSVDQLLDILASATRSQAPATRTHGLVHRSVVHRPALRTVAGENESVVI